MQHSARGTSRAEGGGEQRVGDMLVSLAVVDQDRQVVLRGELELPVENRALHVRRRQVPVVVEPDLADRSSRGLRGEAFEVRPARFVERCGVVRMDPDRRIDQVRVASRQLQRRLGRREVPARDEDALDPGGARPFEDRVEVVVEAGVLEVSVRVDDPRQALGTSTAAQPASSSSTLGKIGTAAPVRQSSGPAPHAASAARPGPPTPCSS